MFLGYVIIGRSKVSEAQCAQSRNLEFHENMTKKNEKQPQDSHVRPSFEHPLPSPVATYLCRGKTYEMGKLDPTFSADERLEQTKFMKTQAGYDDYLAARSKRVTSQLAMAIGEEVDRERNYER